MARSFQVIYNVIFHSNYVCVLYCFLDMASYLSKMAIFLPQVYLLSLRPCNVFNVKRHYLQRFRRSFVKIFGIGKPQAHKATMQR